MSVFRVFGDRPEVRQVIWSGGAFAVSVTVHGNHAYVLDALDGGSLYGYRIADGHLTPVPGSSRRLGLDPDATPQFTNTPGQPLTALGNASTDAGTVDASAAGGVLYVQAGATGIVAL